MTDWCSHESYCQIVSCLTLKGVHELDMYSIVFRGISECNSESKSSKCLSFPHWLYWLFCWLALNRWDLGNVSDFPGTGAAHLYHSHAVWPHCTCCWWNPGEHSSFFKQFFICLQLSKAIYTYKSSVPNLLKHSTHSPLRLQLVKKSRAMYQVWNCIVCCFSLRVFHFLQFHSNFHRVYSPGCIQCLSFLRHRWHR